MSKSAKLAYAPVGVVAGLVGGSIASAIVAKIWALVTRDKDGPPHPRSRSASWPKLVAGAALQGAVFAAVKTAVNRAGARQFERWSGDWPGEE